MLYISYSTNHITHSFYRHNTEDLEKLQVTEHTTDIALQIAVSTYTTDITVDVTVQIFYCR